VKIMQYFVKTNKYKKRKKLLNLQHDHKNNQILKYV